MNQRRFGNYKIVEKEVKGVPVIEVGNIEQTWQVRIPVHYEMYGMLKYMLEELEGGNGDSFKEAINLFLVNFQAVTSIPNGYFHQAVMLLNCVYVTPEILSSSRWNKRRREFMRDVDKLKSNFLNWVKSRDALRAKEEFNHDDHEAETVDEARQILKEEEQS